MDKATQVLYGESNECRHSTSNLKKKNKSDCKDLEVAIVDPIGTFILMVHLHSVFCFLFSFVSTSLLGSRRKQVESKVSVSVLGQPSAKHETGGW